MWGHYPQQPWQDATPPQDVRFIFRGNCVSLGADYIHYITEHEITITYKTFRKNVGMENIRWLEENMFAGGVGVRFCRDWHVSFHRSKTPQGTRVYYLVHSGYEFVWEETEDTNDNRR